MITTARLRLRRFTPDDAALLVELDSDPEVTRYTNHGRPTSRRAITEFILPRFLSYHDDGATPGYDDLGFWAAEEAGAFVGWFHLRPPYAYRDGLSYRPEPENLSRLELGYRLRRDAWGRGLATEGSRAMLALAFARPTTAQVVAVAEPANRASTRVMEKLGMTRRRTFQHPAGVEVVEYAIDAG